MEFIPLVQMAVLVFAIINFLKAVKAKDANASLTQIIVWIAGVAVVFLAAQTDFAEGIMIGDQALTALNVWSLLFIGLTISSLATFGTEVKKALDVSDSARTPNLVTDKAPPPH
jgi:hypothetical protein